MLKYNLNHLNYAPIYEDLNDKSLSELLNKYQNYNTESTEAMIDCIHSKDEVIKKKKEKEFDYATAGSLITAMILTERLIELGEDGVQFDEKLNCKKCENDYSSFESNANSVKKFCSSTCETEAWNGEIN